MRKPEHISIDTYNYSLPEERIARYPLKNRADSKLLIYDSGKIRDDRFQNIANILRKTDHLYFNTTRVVQARLLFRKESGAKIEIFCLEPVNPSDPQLAYSSREAVEFLCLVGNAKKWKEGGLIISAESFSLNAEMVRKQDDKFIIRFSWDNSEYSFAEILEDVGSTPIPPYLKRKAEEGDSKSYQTVYAQQDGSVAAPTAGLHFTREIINDLRLKGLHKSELILHVGAGTFIPVKEDNAVNHHMHAERVSVHRELLKDLLKGERVISVGTTTTRSLESLYWLGIKALNDKGFSFTDLFLDQWDAYSLDDEASIHVSMGALLDRMDAADINEFSFQTRIMITPGYDFKIIDGLFTNFHQPRSTLLLLIAALVGDDWKVIYDYALSHDFRFLSYGDSSLLYRRERA